MKIKKAAIFRWISLFAVMSIITAMLTGCLYSSKQVQEQQVSYRESVDRIQKAIELFQDEQSILPIITAGEETPRYEKFRIDLDKLNKMGYIDEIPVTAFEKGGSAYFLLLDEEVDPKVKVMDLMTVQKVNDVQRQVNTYRNTNDGELPVQDNNETYPGLYTVDLKKAKAESYALKSIFSSQEQSYMVDHVGRVYVDYAFDIMQAIEKSGASATDYDDLRVLLTEQSYFVPVKSLPYQWVDGVPVPQI